MEAIKYILFDAANTLIHKPLMWQRYSDVLKKAGHSVSMEMLKRNHKLISECMNFPDRTSAEFYNRFNAEILYSLGIVSDQNILDEIYKACSYLPWEKFDDVIVLESLRLPLGILSNFHGGLEKVLNEKVGSFFKHIFVSEQHGVSKPDPNFYQIALNKTDVAAQHILYVGDSIKLDMEPAITAGMKTLLLDRGNYFPFFPDRIESLNGLSKYL